MMMMMIMIIIIIIIISKRGSENIQIPIIRNAFTSCMSVRPFRLNTPVLNISRHLKI